MHRLDWLDAALRPWTTGEVHYGWQSADWFYITLGRGSSQMTWMGHTIAHALAHCLRQVADELYDQPDPPEADQIGTDPIQWLLLGFVGPQPATVPSDEYHRRHAARPDETRCGIYLGENVVYRPATEQEMRERTRCSYCWEAKRRPGF